MTAKKKVDLLECVCGGYVSEGGYCPVHMPYSLDEREELPPKGAWYWMRFWVYALLNIDASDEEIDQMVRGKRK